MSLWSIPTITVAIWDSAHIAVHTYSSIHLQCINFRKWYWHELDLRNLHVTLTKIYITLHIVYFILIMVFWSQRWVRFRHVCLGCSGSQQSSIPNCFIFRAEYWFGLIWCSIPRSLTLNADWFTSPLDQTTILSSVNGRALISQGTNFFGTL